MPSAPLNNPKMTQIGKHAQIYYHLRLSVLAVSFLSLVTNPNYSTAIQLNRAPKGKKLPEYDYARDDICRWKPQPQEVSNIA